MYIYIYIHIIQSLYNVVPYSLLVLSKNKQFEWQGHSAGLWQSSTATEHHHQMHSCHEKLVSSLFLRSFGPFFSGRMSRMLCRSTPVLTPADLRIAV